jgi:hypothetical protein
MQSLGNDLSVRYIRDLRPNDFDPQTGAEMGMDFVLDDAQLLPFLNRIRRSDGTLPHFELLLGSQKMGARAVRDQILA